MEPDPSHPIPPSECAPALLPTPAELRASLPGDSTAHRLVRETREAVRDVLHGRDRWRLVMVVGPCSIHDREAALQYAGALRKVARDTREQLVVIMRTYFDKPRSTLGWKGLINDPHLDGTRDLVAGLELARGTLCEINGMGVPCGAELLDPLSVPYLSDLLAWGVIGARTIQSQTHRELASGAPLPIGFKNDTAGCVEHARDAMTAAARPHSYLGSDEAGRPCVVDTTGNPDRHLVLRGGSRPNFEVRDVGRALELVRDQGLSRPVMIDCSHGNSGKDPSRQPGVLRAVLGQVRAGQRGLMGAMLESNLRPGRQDLTRGAAALEYGVSITDACIGWNETEGLLFEAAVAAAAQREGQTRPGRRSVAVHASEQPRSTRRSATGAHP